MLGGSNLCNGLFHDSRLPADAKKADHIRFLPVQSTLSCVHNLRSTWSPSAHGDRGQSICKTLTHAGCDLEVSLLTLPLPLSPGLPSPVLTVPTLRHEDLRGSRIRLGIRSPAAGVAPGRRAPVAQLLWRGAHRWGQT